MEIQKKDLIRELEAENKRCAMYMGFMYKVLQFTFVAIIALAVCAFSTDVTPDGFNVIFRLVLPICFYVFGIMYAFNAYALAECGIREEVIHSAIFNHNADVDGSAEEKVFVDKETYFSIAKNVATNRGITLISYGVPLGFYLVLPMASIYMGSAMNIEPVKLPFIIIKVMPIVCLLVYYVLMSVIIYNISKSHFGINKIQNTIKNDIDNSNSIGVNVIHK